MGEGKECQQHSCCCSAAEGSLTQSVTDSSVPAPNNPKGLCFGVQKKSLCALQPDWLPCSLEVVHAVMSALHQGNCGTAMVIPDCTTHQSIEPGVPPGNNPQMIYNEGNTVRLWFFKGEASMLYPGLTEVGTQALCFLCQDSETHWANLEAPKRSWFPMAKTTDFWLPWVY